MVSKAKLYTKLDALELHLKQSLIPHLQAAVLGENDFLFCVKQFNSISKFKHKTNKITEELIELGSEVLTLREKLGESSRGSLAERLCWYCRQWDQAINANKNITTTLAKQFLDEVEAS